MQSITSRCKKGIMLLIAASCGFAQQQSYSQKDFEALGQINGTWRCIRSDGEIFETWKRKNNTEFTGISYMVSKADTVPLETVRLYIESGQIIYAPLTASQPQQQHVLFTLRSTDGHRFVFENPKHDFPTRIVYDFKGKDSLLAYIEGKVEGKPRRIDYPYKRMR